MARNSTARGKIVRRLGVNIYGNSKYDRLLRKKPNPPGVERGRKMRGKLSTHAMQMIEKQKIKFAYEVSEKQFKNTFVAAKKLPGITGDNLMILLEKRLDNVAYRMGLATTRAAARQFVSHGHLYLNGRRVDVASAQVRVGDVIEVKPMSEKSKNLARIALSKSNEKIASWLSFDTDSLKGKIEREPVRADINTIGNEQVVVEFYSK
ncbi:MAG: 30S ribosomal protein S4 [Spirochaetaceae bacterium]|nr:30S ribosomal protein S4 [Spirochaetaceae bacterium]